MIIGSWTQRFVQQWFGHDFLYEAWFSMKLRRHLSNGGCSRFPTTTISWLLMMVWPDQTLTDVLFSKLMLCQASQLAAPREIWCWQISGRDSYNRMQSPSGKEFYSSFLRGAPHEVTYQTMDYSFLKSSTEARSAEESLYWYKHIFHPVWFGSGWVCQFSLVRFGLFGSLWFGSFRFVVLDWLKVRKYNAEWHTALTLMRFSLLGDFRSTLSQSLGRNKPMCGQRPSPLYYGSCQRKIKLPF